MKRLLGLSLTIALLGCVQPAAAGDIEVMTQNQYLGADLAPLATAPDLGAFNNALVTALQQIAGNLPTERIRALADKIAKRQPELVGLQEVFLFECVDLRPSTPGQGCDNPSIAGAFVDHLQETLNALNGAYVAKAVVTNLNLTPGIPFDIGGSLALVRVVDRDVILARSDVAATRVDFTPFQRFGLCPRPVGDGCNYQTVLTVNTPVGDVSFERGFVAVDATVEGKAYRFVNTHLEVQQPDPTDPLSSILQAAQAAELIETLRVTTPTERSLIVVGDINSSPEDMAIPGPLLPPPFNLGIIPPYAQFVGAGYTDAWTLRPGKRLGFTCCQLGDLSNHKSVLSERIDVIWSIELPARVKKARVVGATVSDKTAPPGRGLWPSDHGAVAAELLFY